MVEQLRRNSIFDRIVQEGHDPSAFTRVLGTDPAQTLVITHTGSGARFAIHPIASMYDVIMLVDDGDPVAPSRMDWASVLNHLGMWLQAVQIDLETPDLWEQYEKTEVIEGELVSENTPFTPDERAEIEKRIQELKEYVVTEHPGSGSV